MTAQISLDDGVPTRAATFTVADQKLNGFKVSRLYNANDPHVRVYFALLDGTFAVAVKVIRYVYMILYNYPISSV